ncbi:MAG: nucleotide sugar dehydrogenase [Candidatus Aceula meridiana]|nr:nucleotide sugar dehydrogenase [Candidatus Aceula meridiana]
MQKLKRKIISKKAKIAVIGLGYVGLPLAVSFAKAGFMVLGLDNNKSRVDRIRKGKSYIKDVAVKDITSLIRKKTFQASTDLSLLKQVDVVLICVPTPLKRKYTPDISYIVSAVKTIGKFMTKDKLIILESTTYPGTTEELIKPLLEKSGMKSEKDFYLAFSPERIDPGNKKYPVTKIPKVVGGLSEASSSLAKVLYRKIVNKVHVVSSPRAAEMTKLLENTFRLINIGWVNEAAMMCDKLGINIWEVIEAAKTKPFGFMPFYPSLGVGGHCIPDDPLYLFWKARHHGVSSKFIKLSADINEKIPEYILTRVEGLFKKKVKKILVLGATYKKDVKDLRRSPAVKFIETAKKRGHSVSYFDPLIPYLEMGALHLKSIKLNSKAIKQFDCVVIAVAHTGVNYRMILDSARYVFDACNAYKGKKNSKIIVL